MTPKYLTSNEWREARDRFDFCIQLINDADCKSIAEIGVWKGDFAARILEACPQIDKYVMVDPWRHLEGWNKPSNVNEERFAQIFESAMTATSRWAHKRIVMRETTVRAMRKVEDGQLDVAYIDGDHTLRGITIDLLSVFPKVRHHGLILGDDLSPTIWQHPKVYEPTLIFPFAVHFAEAVGCPIFAGPFCQFVIVNAPELGFSFTDLTGNYPETTIRAQMLTPPLR